MLVSVGHGGGTLDLVWLAVKEEEGLAINDVYITQVIHAQK